MLEMFQHGHAEGGQIAAIRRRDQTLAVLMLAGSKHASIFSSFTKSSETWLIPLMDALLTLKMYAT